MKRQVIKPFKPPRNTGDKTGQQRQVKRLSETQQVTPLAHQRPSDTEEPTELGLVWPQPAVKDVIEKPSNPWWPAETLGGKDAEQQPSNGKDVMEESPRLSNYESEGFIARRIERTTPQKFSDGFKLLALARQKAKEELALKRAKADLQAPGFPCHAQATFRAIASI